ncbi:MAG: chromosomal replication initiator protein DnaA [Puniceicoccales bacterium]|jgi:chromosomal replication initiator protein|nr:chromosomal replication initiator protein DnaA [Puniceicoccales bacterium]
MPNLVDINDVWSVVKEDFKKSFPSDVYSAWFDTIHGVKPGTDDSLIIMVPNDFAAIWIHDNYRDILIDKFQMALGHSTEISFEVVCDSVPMDGSCKKSSKKNQIKASAASKVCSSDPSEEYMLSPRNTFENFIIGSGNQMAHAASIAIANTPAKAYNPLFLYGFTGLGKTHLMHAVAHHILANNRNSKVVYISTEKLTNEFIQAIQANSMTRFRSKYRNVDILLLDDVHFLSGKERIQEEFFYTFNELFESQKQIFLCSDRPASEIAELESRLVSRFQWGLVTDIQPPDLETRIAILSRKAADMHLVLDNDVLLYLAERVSTNVRRLEGALTRLAGFMKLSRARIDIQYIKIIMRDIFEEEKNIQLSIDTIQQRIAEFFKIKVSDILGKRRPANIALPRQIAMYLSRSLTTLSLVDIGLAFGGRDHGTVIHACKSIENVMEIDPVLKRNVDHLKKILQNK